MARKQYRSHKIVLIRLRVRELAEQRGISRTKLSQRSEVQYSTINRIWQNEYHDVSLQVAVKIAQALKVNVNDLYEVIPDE
jgi:DNA-binding Xre family transcriptional regulator